MRPCLSHAVRLEVQGYFVYFQALLVFLRILSIGNFVFHLLSEEDMWAMNNQPSLYEWQMS